MSVENTNGELSVFIHHDKYLARPKLISVNNNDAALPSRTPHFVNPETRLWRWPSGIGKFAEHTAVYHKKH